MEGKAQKPPSGRSSNLSSFATTPTSPGEWFARVALLAQVMVLLTPSREALG